MHHCTNIQQQLLDVLSMLSRKRKSWKLSHLMHKNFYAISCTVRVPDSIVKVLNPIKP